MKRFSLKAMILALTLSMVSGCALIEGVNDSLNYVESTTAYINDTSAFADKIRNLAEQAPGDPEAIQALKKELESMKEKVLNYNTIEVPELAKDLHQELLSYNEKLLTEINGYLEQINNQMDINLKGIMDSEIMKTIKEINEIIQKLEQLGF